MRGTPLHPGAEPGLCRLRTEGLWRVRAQEEPRLPAEMGIHGPGGAAGCLRRRGVCRRDSVEVLVDGTGRARG